MGLLNEIGQVSPDGVLATRLPLEPRHAAAFIQACRSNPAPAWEVSAIVSLLNEDTVFVEAGAWGNSIRAHFMNSDGDTMTLLNVWYHFHHELRVGCAGKSAAAREEHLYQWCKRWFLNYERLMNAKRTFETLIGIAHKEMNLSAKQKVLPANSAVWMSPRFSQVVRKTLLKAGFLQLAVKEPKGDGYRTLGENNPGLISPTSSIVGRDFEFVLYDTFLRTSKCFFMNVTGIDSQWLFENRLSSIYVDSLLSGYIKNSEKWLPIKQLGAAKAKFTRGN